MFTRGYSRLGDTIPKNCTADLVKF